MVKSRIGIVILIFLSVLNCSCSKSIKHVTTSNTKSKTEQSTKIDSSSNIESSKNKINDLSIQLIQISIDSNDIKENSLDGKLDKIKRMTGLRLTAGDLSPGIGEDGAILTALVINSRTVESDSSITTVGIQKSQQTNVKTKTDSEESTSMKKGGAFERILFLLLLILLIISFIIVKLRGGTLKGVFSKVFKFFK